MCHIYLSVPTFPQAPKPAPSWRLGSHVSARRPLSFLDVVCDRVGGPTLQFNIEAHFGSGAVAQGVGEPSPALGPIVKYPVAQRTGTMKSGPTATTIHSSAADGVMAMLVRTGSHEATQDKALSKLTGRATPW